MDDERRVDGMDERRVDGMHERSVNNRGWDNRLGDERSGDDRVGNNRGDHSCDRSTVYDVPAQVSLVLSKVLASGAGGTHDEEWLTATGCVMSGAECTTGPPTKTPGAAAATARTHEITN